METEISQIREALGLDPGRHTVDIVAPPMPTYIITLANARPMLDRLMARIIPDPVTTKTGLHVPDVARDRPLQALVVAVGPGKALDNGRALPMGVKAGDVVLFQKFNGSEIRVDGEPFLMLRQDEVLCVFPQEPPTA
jgi:chaperonin GroES